MSNFDSDGSSENEWDEQGELAWSEFEWEKYLQQQDEVIRTYLSHYDKLKTNTDRIDEVAHLMGWDYDTWTGDDTQDDSATAPKVTDEEMADFELDPYTFHKNPIFISTKALYLSLKTSWEKIAADIKRVSPALALAVLSSLQRGEENALFAIQSLDMGDYALGVSLFKRALRELNHTLSLLDTATNSGPFLASYKEYALTRLFDLREIWLRVMNECREELGRNVDESSSE